MLDFLSIFNLRFFGCRLGILNDIGCLCCLPILKMFPCLAFECAPFASLCSVLTEMSFLIDGISF